MSENQEWKVFVIYDCDWVKDIDKAIHYLELLKQQKYENGDQVQQKK